MIIGNACFIKEGIHTCIKVRVVTSDCALLDYVLCETNEER